MTMFIGIYGGYLTWKGDIESTPHAYSWLACQPPHSFHFKQQNPHVFDM